MPRPRAPWWMYLVAASFLGYSALLVYCQFIGPESLGVSAEFRGALIVWEVVPNSPADRVGLKKGDRVVAVDGLAIRNQVDWQAIEANLEANRPMRLHIERGGERRETMLTLRARSPELSPRGLLVPFMRLLILLLAFIIAFSRPHDPVARAGAWLLGTIAVLAPSPPLGIGVVWRHLPTPLAGVLWISIVSSFFFPAILFTFFAIFPRSLFRARWVWAFVWTPLLFLCPWLFSLVYRMYYRPDRAVGNPDWLLPAFGLSTVAYIVGGLGALGVNYRRLEDVNERRRVRVLVAGAVAAWLAVIPQILFLFWESLSDSQIIWVVTSPPVRIVIVLLFFSFPLSFAYAILRHRVFDIRIMIRQGLQYALMRHVVIGAVPVLAGILLLDLFLHGDRPMHAVLGERGWMYATLGALALIAHVQRQRWMEALDRRFFRDRYDAQRLLREVVDEIRAARSLERVAPRVVAHIEAALHPGFAALVVREPHEAAFRSLAAAPAGQAPPPLPTTSKLIALVHVLGKPVNISLAEAGWLQQQLPHEETDFLQRAQIELLVPVTLAPERTEALLVLGSKRSEEPYSREDQDLLIAVATSLALLMEKPALVEAPAASRALAECPQCGTCYDTGTSRCAQEGVSLVPVPLPRLLAARYRLERRLGRGGMGTVYEASDTALERRVAVKVIREGLVGSADAAERFRHEARAAAAFAHPNVVTVHDFGTAAGTRAFLVMELLSGPTLREELRGEGRLPAPRTLEILEGVSSAVDAAHRRQLIHRDLKPENVVLARTETGETSKVLDFGIAKFLPTATESTLDTGTGVVVGTLHYLSPEQLCGGVAQPAWDLWALAVMAYEMLTGARPFQDASVSDLHGAVLAGRFIPLTHHLPDAPARWQEFFAMALAPEAEHRPKTARDFFSELRQALG